MEAPQWIIAAWIVLKAIIAAWIALKALTELVRANGESSPQMRMWRALGLPVLITCVLIWGGFFPSPF